MDFSNMIKRTDLEPRAGRLLIAEPFMADPHFMRTVIFLCEYNDDGAMGFIINRLSDHSLATALPELYTPNVPLFKGGPLHLETLHVIHQMPKALSGKEVLPDIFWGGKYEELSDLVHANSMNAEKVKLVHGYAGWGKEQLEKEIEEGNWIIANASEELLFHTDANDIWKKTLQSLGKDFHFMTQLPIHPQLN